jgi:hypothetical protein
MSEADRDFPVRKGQGFQTLTSEKRHILSVPRRSGPGAGKSRAVEVVPIRQDRSRLTEDHPHPAPASLHAETWPDKLQAKLVQPLPPQNTQPVAPEIVKRRGCAVAATCDAPSTIAALEAADPSGLDPVRSLRDWHGHAERSAAH